MQTASEPDEDASFEPEADSESVLWQTKQTKLVANGAFCAEDVTTAAFTGESSALRLVLPTHDLNDRHGQSSARRSRA